MSRSRNSRKGSKTYKGEYESRRNVTPGAGPGGKGGKPTCKQIASRRARRTWKPEDAKGAPR